MKKEFLTYPEWQATADTLHMLLQIRGNIMSYPLSYK